MLLLEFQRVPVEEATITGRSEDALLTNRLTYSGVEVAKPRVAAQLEDMHESVAKCIECMVVVLLRLLPHVDFRPCIRSPIVIKFPDKILTRMIDKEFWPLKRRPVIVADDNVPCG